MGESRKFRGLPLYIEYKEGEIKKDKERPWSYGWHMEADYGYIEGTVSAEEKEELDVYVGPVSEDDPRTDCAYLGMLVHEDGSFNEIKVLLGFADLEHALETFQIQYGEWRAPYVIKTTIKEIMELVDFEKTKYEKEKNLVLYE